MSVLERLKAAGVNLPEPRPPVANYVPFVITGNGLYLKARLLIGTVPVQSSYANTNNFAEFRINGRPSVK